MPASFYLALHLMSLIGLVASLTFLLLSEKTNKKAQMFAGICSLLLLTGGFGLLAKNHISMHSGWVAVKLVIWGLLAVATPFIAKRFEIYKKKWFSASLVLLCVAVYMVVYKPF